MTVQVISAADAVAMLDQFGAVIDARSPAEFAQDHLPSALNWPTLDDEERKLVGTIYAQVSPFEAAKRGAALAAANIARHIARDVMDKPKSWRPLVYCWRGGKRSGALALVLDQIGFRTSVVEGGYKAFRAAVLAHLPGLVAGLRFCVVCGPTGSGKTRLLQALERAGAQVLDLEALANHRSSVLGQVPGQEQPTQKRFDTVVWERLRSFDQGRPVYVESESRKVGNLAVPDALIGAMRASPCLRLEMPLDQRVALLLEDYEFFTRDAALFCDRLSALTTLRGKTVVQEWHAMVGAGAFEAVVRDLLLRHYDPGYASSIGKNFHGYPGAGMFHAPDRSHQALDSLALEIMAQTG